MGSVPAPRPPFSVSSIAIIGAGPTGLACARYLAAQAAFKRQNIVVFEQQAEVGGVWNYSPRAAPVLAAVPQTNAHGGPEPALPQEEEGDRGAGGPAVFPSPMYARLYANIPAPLMRYSDRGFGEGDVIFPPRERIQSYLVEAAADLRDRIRLSTTVEDVRLAVDPSDAAAPPGAQERWAIRSRNLVTGATATEVFDAVVVANGHYSTPYVPDVPGLREFARQHPERVRHSKQYRTPEPYQGQKLLLVGNSASGLDLASQIGPHCAPPLHVSVHTPTPAAQRAAAGGFDEVPEVARFLPAERGVELADGQRLDGLDAVLFCTGYLYTFPFLEAQMAADAARESTTPLVTDGRRVHGLYRHLVHIQHPTLAFAGLPVKVIPFPLAEAQAALLARLWANEISLPPPAAMEAWERDEAATRGSAAFHVFPKGADGAYINALHDWIQGAAGAEPARTGKMPPRWDSEALWMRAITPEAKLAFERTGRTATSLAALGFVYRPDEAAADKTRPPQPGENVAGKMA